AIAATGGAERPQKIPASSLMTGRRLIPLALALAMLAPALAEEQPSRPSSDKQHEQQAQQHGPGVLRLLPGDAVSEHTIELPTGKLTYKATAGTFPLIDTSGERKAEVFYTAYVV